MSDPVDRPALTHLDAAGRPRMVDVAEKASTSRSARAEGWIRMTPETLEAMVKGGPKGSALRVAELAGIQGGKRTGELIPLCHILPAVSMDVEVFADTELPGLRVRSTARIRGSTGVEMEALTGVSVALLTLYDMGKALEKGMEIGGIRLLEKVGGKGGSWTV